MKNKFNTYRLRSIAFVLGILGIAILSYSATYAYLTSTDRVNNDFTPGENTIRIDEDFKCNDKYLKHGSRCTKTPKITNTGNESTYVRVRIKFSSIEAENQCDPLVIDSNWKKDGDFYYYNKILKPGETTPAIFSFFKIKDSMNDADIIDFKIIVAAESANSDGYANAKEAFAVVGGI